MLNRLDAIVTLEITAAARVPLCRDKHNKESLSCGGPLFTKPKPQQTHIGQPPGTRHTTQHPLRNQHCDGTHHFPQDMVRDKETTGRQPLWLSPALASCHPSKLTMHAPWTLTMHPSQVNFMRGVT